MTKQFSLVDGNYRFTAYYNKGMRLYVVAVRYIANGTDELVAERALKDFGECIAFICGFQALQMFLDRYECEVE